MSNIKIVNLRFEKADFRCDRSSPLGNPFPMGHEANRDKVCDQYEKYFYKSLNPDISPRGFLEHLDMILTAANHGPISIGCWCAPKRCHCDTIKTWLESNLS